MSNKELVLKKFSAQSLPTVCRANTIPVLYMTEDLQKDFHIYLTAVNINGMPIGWDVFDVLS